MGEVVPARTSPTLHLPSPPTVLEFLNVSQTPSASIVNLRPTAAHTVLMQSLYMHPTVKTDGVGSKKWYAMLYVFAVRYCQFSIICTAQKSHYPPGNHHASHF